MTDSKSLEKIAVIAFENAKQFLKDSKILQKEGSIGHATSLAILGYEEAHKAYLLSLFHPLFDGLVSEGYRSELMGQLKDHSWKQIHAKSFRVCIEELLGSGVITEEDRIEAGFPTLAELKESTDFAFSKKLNKMKNDGFYTELRGEQVWDPSGISNRALIAVHKLLETQINSVEMVIKQLSELDKIPEDKIESARANIKDLLNSLQKAQTCDISSVVELEEILSKHGEIGDFVSVLARAFLRDNRFRRIQQEKQKKKKKLNDE